MIYRSQTVSSHQLTAIQQALCLLYRESEIVSLPNTACTRRGYRLALAEFRAVPASRPREGVFDTSRAGDAHVKLQMSISC